jgi:hypothetical protein
MLSLSSTFGRIRGPSSILPCPPPGLQEIPEGPSGPTGAPRAPPKGRGRGAYRAAGPQGGEQR